MTWRRRRRRRRGRRGGTRCRPAPDGQAPADLSLGDEFSLILGPPVPVGGGEPDPVEVERLRGLWAIHGAALLESGPTIRRGLSGLCSGVPDDVRDGDAEVRRDWVRRVLLAGQT